MRLGGSRSYAHVIGGHPRMNGDVITRCRSGRPTRPVVGRPAAVLLELARVVEPGYDDKYCSRTDFDAAAIEIRATLSKLPEQP